MLEPETNYAHSADLKQAYLRHLPERIGAIGEHWNRLIQGEWSQAGLNRLFQRIQDLAGSAGKFALVQVSDNVLTLESRLNPLLDERVTPSEGLLRDISALIRRLRSAADGMELTSIIREQQEFVGIPIVFVSGEQNTAKQLDALSLGGDDSIAKPIRPRHLIATIKNRIQRVRALRDQTAFQGHRDPVTRLFNRRHFFERLDSAVAANRSQAGSLGVLYAQLDRHEEIRTQFGVDHIDALLAQIGSVVAARTEPQDVCARTDGAGFAVLAMRPLEPQPGPTGAGPGRQRGRTRLRQRRPAVPTHPEPGPVLPRYRHRGRLQPGEPGCQILRPGPSSGWQPGKGSQWKQRGDRTGRGARTPGHPNPVA
jgi:GGDEF domain-containing protein